MSFFGLRKAISFCLSIILILILVQLSVHPAMGPNAGFVWLYDLPNENVVFHLLEDRLEFDLIEPGVRLSLGLANLLACLFLLSQSARRASAFYVLIVFATLCALHLSSILGTRLPLSVSNTELGDDGGVNFMLHLCIFCLAVLIFVVHPNRSRPR